MILGLTPRELVAALLLAGGLFFTLVAVIGLWRLPDFYTRLHAVSKSETAGLLLTLAGLALLSADWSVALKLSLVWAFLGLAGPTATHALGRAALRSGLPVWSGGRTSERSAGR